MYATLTTTVAPALEPVTTTLARKHCRVDNADDDDLILTYVQTARALAENYLSRALVTQTLTYTTSQANSYGTGGWPVTYSAPLILPLWLPSQLFYQQPIQLPRAPVQSVASITVGNPDGTSTTLPTTAYSVDVASTPGRVLINAGSQPGPGQDVAISFVAGYGTDPASVPAPIRTAVLFLTAWLYEHRGDEPLDLPETAYMLMTPYRLVGFGGG